MSLQMQAQRAYARPDATLRNPRSVEYDLLAQCTTALKSAGQEHFSSLAAAVDANLRLWTMLGADVSSPGNALPAPLRARLFYLYQFTADHSRNILSGDASVEVLVDINTAVMRGLRGEGSAS